MIYEYLNARSHSQPRMPPPQLTERSKHDRTQVMSEQDQIERHVTFGATTTYPTNKTYHHRKIEVTGLGGIKWKLRSARGGDIHVSPTVDGETEEGGLSSFCLHIDPALRMDTARGSSNGLVNVATVAACLSDTVTKCVDLAENGEISKDEIIESFNRDLEFVFKDGEWNLIRPMESSRDSKLPLQTIKGSEFEGFPIQGFEATIRRYTAEQTSRVYSLMASVLGKARPSDPDVRRILRRLDPSVFQSEPARDLEEEKNETHGNVDFSLFRISPLQQGTTTTDSGDEPDELALTRVRPSSSRRPSVGRSGPSSQETSARRLSQRAPGRAPHSGSRSQRPGSSKEVGVGSMDSGSSELSIGVDSTTSTTPRVDRSDMRLRTVNEDIPTPGEQWSLHLAESEDDT